MHPILRRTMLSFTCAFALVLACWAGGIGLCPGFGLAQNTIPFFQPGKIRVLIISGRNNHDWRSTTPFLRKVLVESGRFDVRVEEEPAGITAATLEAYDALVLDYEGPRWGEVTEKAVVDFVKQGKGLVAVHAANYAFTGLEVLADHHKPSGLKQPPWPEYLQMMGGWWTDGPPKTAHAPRHCFTVKFVNREHPVTHGLDESFRTSDELYHSPRMSPRAHILATAFDDPANGGTGMDEPIIWTVNYGRGRTLYTALGHDLSAQQESGYVSTFTRGVEWAATGAVTLPSPIGPGLGPRPRPRPCACWWSPAGTLTPPLSTRSLKARTTCTGITPFRTTRPTAPTSARSTTSWCSTTLPRTSATLTRTNLRDFVEAGKGIVVLHHAIADYQDWVWWYKEVVGGKYLMKPDGSTPASTYLHDQEACVTPVMRHPITAHIGAMHLWDETYKGMWISPDVKVLLRSDAPTSDGPVAWISPYPKSRVVYIQLGHGESAHLYPAYRELVQDAIRWTGGR